MQTMPNTITHLSNEKCVGEIIDYLEMNENHDTNSESDDDTDSTESSHSTSVSESEGLGKHHLIRLLTFSHSLFHTSNFLRLHTQTKHKKIFYLFFV